MKLKFNKEVKALFFYFLFSLPENWSAIVAGMSSLFG